MTTHRYPALVWESHEGTYTACLIRDEGNIVAVGRSEQEALRQTRELLSWWDRQGVYLPEPDLEEVRLVHYRVSVRPEYKVPAAKTARVLPCDEEIGLRIACVHGRRGLGLRVAHLPRLDLCFFFYEGQALRELVTHYVRQALQGRTPRALALHLPPKRTILHDVAVNVTGRGRRRRRSFELTALESVAEPLSDRAVTRQFVRPWGREAQVEELVQRLGKERHNVLLLGSPGCGKTTVLVAAARKLERLRRETHSPGAPRFWGSSASRFIAGMPYLGQWEERAEGVIEELSRVEGVLCLDDLLEAVRIGGRTPRDSVASFFIPYLRHGELRLVVEATPAEIEACRRLLPGLVELFSVVEVPELDRKASLAVLERLGESCARQARVEPERGAIATAHRLFLRFAPYQAFPGKAGAFLRERFEQAERERRDQLAVSDVVAAFVRRTGIPERFVRDDLPLTREQVLDELRARVIGQDPACAVAADLVLTFKAGLNDPGRPLGVLLFCGPTGVGKTALARELAKCFFGAGEETDRLVRLDMSEYSGLGAAERLLGPPDQPSDLIRRLRQQPFSLLLLDEIEKAAPEVFDLLLGVFDEGRLTDRYGRVTTFRSAVIVATSNLGAGKEQALGFGDGPAATYEDEVMRFFRPEFFNRIDRVVPFVPLDPEAMRAIARKELGELREREGIRRTRAELRWTDALLEHVVARGFDRRYGARPLQRTVESLVVTPLARFLIAHPGLRGGALVLDLDAASRELCVEHQADA